MSDPVSRGWGNSVHPFIFEDRNHLSFGRTSWPSSTNLMFQIEGKDTCRVSNNSLRPYILGTYNTYIGFKVLTAMAMRKSISWDIMQCSSVRVDRRFGGTYQLYHHDLRPRQARSKQGADFLLGLLFGSEQRSVTFLRNVCLLSADYLVLYLRSKSSF